MVLGFLTPPGAGTEGVALKALFAFERVHVAKGATMTVTLYPAFTDFTAVTHSGGRVALSGEYMVTFGVAEAAPHGMGFVSHQFNAK